jgi:signal peptide peptidase SppA
MAKQKGHMEYPQIVKAITGTPWLILPDSLNTIIEIVNSKLNGDAFSDEEIRMRLAAADQEAKDNPRIQVGGGVGIISLHGPVFPRANLMTAISGATSLETFQSDFQELLANSDVKQIVMDINSPGGASDLVHETGMMIRAAREQKPVYAVANTVAGSAALWLLSQATEAYATPSGKVGSLGVYTVHEDTSAQDAAEGRKITIVSSGEYKTALSPHEPLSEQARQYMQESVDELKTEFVNEVALGRNLSSEYVDEHFGNAKLFSPKKAHEIKMVDGVRSMSQVIGQLVENNAATGVGRAKSSLEQHVQRVHQEGGLFHLEHKEEEHAEPGTGSPPQPRKDEAGEDDIAIREGWRGDGRLPLDPHAPGAPSPNPSKPNTNANAEGGESILTDEQLNALKASVGLTSSASEDELLEKVKNISTEHATLSVAKAKSESEKLFADQNPQMYAEHMRLLDKDRTNEAKSFAASVSKIKRPVGDTFEDTGFGLSALAVETIAEAHIKFAKGEGTTADFENAISSISTGMVKFTEDGSSRPKNPPEVDTATRVGLMKARQDFAGIVDQVRSEYAQNNNGKVMDYLEAVQEAAKRDPELAEAYTMTSTQ